METQLDGKSETCRAPNVRDLRVPDTKDLPRSQGKKRDGLRRPLKLDREAEHID